MAASNFETCVDHSPRVFYLLLRTMTISNSILDQNSPYPSFVFEIAYTNEDIQLLRSASEKRFSPNPNIKVWPGIKKKKSNPVETEFLVRMWGGRG